MWHFEAGWNPNGARWLWMARLMYDPQWAAMGFGEYMQQHPYCSRDTSFGKTGFDMIDAYDPNWSHAYTTDSTSSLIASERFYSCEGDDCPP